MSRIELMTETKAQGVMDALYADVTRRIDASQPGLCPVDLTASFLRLSTAQSCGKCVPCRVGLRQIYRLIEQVQEGEATRETLETIEETAEGIYYSADCAIGSEAALMVLKSIRGFREEYEAHVFEDKCHGGLEGSVPCVTLCPAHVDIPGYVALIHEGRYDDAVNLIRKDNPLPIVCGLICEHPCEEKCRRKLVDDAINIRGLKRYATLHEGKIKVPEKYAKTGKKVAVIGAGPAGLTAAYYLSIMGHNVTVYEQRKQPGGMLRYGIPAYRLPRKELDKEITAMTKTGFKIRTNVSIGTDLSFAELKEKNDAVFVAIGAHTDKKLGIDGEDAKGVLSAVEMLRAIGDDVLPDFKGKRIVVVGGGNVAMDVARSAVRLGAKSVDIAYRRRKEDMTALPEEVEGAIADGCEVVEMHAPVRIEKDKKGNVKAFVMQPQIVGPIDKGRPKPVKASAEEVVMPCDYVLVAIGQGIDSDSFGEAGLPLKWDQIDALEDCSITGHDGVFSGGDCVTGPATVIKAIAAGKVAAANIDTYLGFHHEIATDLTMPEVRLDDHAPLGRVKLRERPAAERSKDFELMECPMTDEEACQESGRCLHCDHFGMGGFREGRKMSW